MSAKKKDLNGWIQCNTCFALHLKDNVSKHSDCCEGEVSLLHLNKLFDYTSIVEDTFYGEVKCYHANSGVKLPTDKYDIVLIHPTTFKICNFQVATTVCISSRSKQTYGTIWPSSSIPFGQVFLQSSKFRSLNVSDNDILQIKKVNIFPVLATTVALQPISSHSDEHFELLRDVLLNELDDIYLICGDFVAVSHYGQEHFFTVNRLDTSVSTESSMVTNVEGLSTNFERLGLNCDLQQKGPDLVCHVMFQETKLELVKNCDQENKQNNNSFQDSIGGLFSQKKLFDEIITQPFKYSLLYEQCGIHVPHGVLVYGHSGTGKSSFVKNFISSTPSINTKMISGPEIISKYQGESEGNLRSTFEEARSKAPSVLVIDEFDSICPKLKASSNDSDKRMVTTICSLMDSIEPCSLFVVLAITNKLDNVDISLRRPGRFDREVEFGIPNSVERLDVFKTLLNLYNHTLTEHNFVELSEITHGYVGADINALVKESGLIAVKRCIDSDNIEQFSVSLPDVKIALSKIGPSAMKEITVDVPKVFWKDVGGQHLVKQKLLEATEWPLKHPDVFIKMGITPPRGLLMYGPPGCSKTLMAKALATESGLNFISIKGPEFFSKYLGESERAVRRVFQKARTASPSILFFDEIDAIGVQRSQNNDGNNASDRVLAQILTELDGVEPLDDVIIVAATNRPDIIDPALLRPGRIDRLVYVPLPDSNTRREIFQIQFRAIPLGSDVCLEKLVDMSSGYSGAEICSLCRESALIALREDFSCSEVKFRHFETIFNQIKPGTSKSMVDFYEQFVSKTTTF